VFEKRKKKITAIIAKQAAKRYVVRMRFHGAAGGSVMMEQGYAGGCFKGVGGFFLL